MKKLFLTALFVVLSVVPVSAQIEIPFSNFVSGQIIASGESNTNFSILADAALNRSGGTISGHITVDPGVTIDGLDISNWFINGSVRAQANGSASKVAFGFADGDGIYFNPPNEFWFAVGSAGAMALHSGGLTVYNNNIFNSSGKIPAITSTYFSSLDGSALSYQEASIADGSLLARRTVTETISGAWDFDSKLSITPSWNNAGVSFTGLDINVTNTASGSNSWLSTFREGGVLKTSVTKTGKLISLGLRITSAPKAGAVLVSDSNGVGQWVDLSDAVPAGMLAFFEGSCPAGWTRRDIYDNKFLRGGPSFDSAGGGQGASHTHLIDPPNTATSSAGAHTHSVDFPSTSTTSDGSHSHAWNLAGHDTSFAGNHTHSFDIPSFSSTAPSSTDGGQRELSAPDFNVGGGGHTHSADPPSTNSSVAGEHRHSFSDSPTGTAGSHSHTLDLSAESTTSAGAHTHTVNIGQFSSPTAATTTLPPYIDTVICKKD